MFHFPSKDYNTHAAGSDNHPSIRLASSIRSAGQQQQQQHRQQQHRQPVHQPTRQQISTTTIRSRIQIGGGGGGGGSGAVVVDHHFPRRLSIPEEEQRDTLRQYYYCYVDGAFTTTAAFQQRPTAAVVNHRLLLTGEKPVDEGGQQGFPPQHQRQRRQRFQNVYTIYNNNNNIGSARTKQQRTTTITTSSTNHHRYFIRRNRRRHLPPAARREAYTGPRRKVSGLKPPYAGIGSVSTGSHHRRNRISYQQFTPYYQASFRRGIKTGEYRDSPPIFYRELGRPNRTTVTRLVPSCKTRGLLPGSDDLAERTSPKLFVWLDKSGSSSGSDDRSVLGRGERRMKVIEEIPTNDYVMECHNLSYIRSFTTGTFYSKLFNPPITAQFLKDINMEVHGGEVMGIIGATGSGKTTLLNVIARRVQGTTGGAILLNHRPMTQATFQKNCSYVSFKSPLNENLTVRDTLRFQADLSIASSFSRREKVERVNQMLRDFELMDYGRRRVGDLSEAAHRRLLVALSLVRDPLLILIDDPTGGLDPLSSYQLMYCIFQYTKRRNRMAIIGSSMPRSDIYQLFDRMTILFFGEVLYSGYTKQMPHYFQQIGYPCPQNENPAVYFLSLATVDRETSERYLETQDQAVRLIELYKRQGVHLSSQYRGPTNINNLAGGMNNNNVGDHIYSPNPYLPMSHLGRPGLLKILWTLISRNAKTYVGGKMALFGRLFALPLFCSLLFLLYFRVGTEEDVDLLGRGGLIFNLLIATTFISAAVTATNFEIQRGRFHQETWDGMYPPAMFILSNILLNLFLDLIPIASSTAIVHWGCDLSLTSLHATIESSPVAGSTLDWLILLGVSWSVWTWTQLCTVVSLLFVRDWFDALATTTTFLSLMAVPSAGFLKSQQAYLKTPGAPTDWIYYATYGSIYRYAGATLNYQYIHNITRTCPRGVDYCRWESGQEYLNEIYPAEALEDFWLNFGLCFGLVGIMTLLTVTLYTIPLPHFIKRKFRFK